MRYYGKYEKCGKYERRPEVACAKQPKAKSMLLQTYFTGLLSLVLCVTMFFGTTYAWFTSEVTNTGNEIYVGTLAVGLYKIDSQGNKADLTSSETNDKKLFDANIRWEPGYTAMETIEVVNKGDLAFKYVLNFTYSDEQDKADLADAAASFDVWVYDHYSNTAAGKTYEAPASYNEVSVENGWTSVGTLAQLLNGKTVLAGNMVNSTQAENAANDGTTDGVATADRYTIALHMNETVSDPSVMGKKISLNVKLVAYQTGYEEDDLGS